MSVVEMAVGREQQRCDDIVALCSSAGHIDKAAGFIQAKLPIDAVRRELHRQQHNPDASPITARAEGTTANAKYIAEYAQMPTAYQAAGVSEADYVASRRVDDGLDTLTNATAFG